MSASVDEPKYDAEAFIQHEDAFAVVTVDGWLKRLRELKDPKQTRLREGDEVLAVLQGSTSELRRPLLEPRLGLRPPAQRRPALDRLRRAGPEALQVRGRRAGRRGALPRPARHAGRRTSSSSPPRGAESSSGSRSTRSARRRPAPAAGSRSRRRATRSSCRSSATRRTLVALASEKGRAILFDAERGPGPRRPGQGSPRHPARAGRPGRRRGALRRRTRSARS